MSRYRCTLTTRDGASRRVDALGIVIGRDQDCDIVVDDPAVSRRHALVRVDAEGAELVALGRVPVLLSGKPIDRHHRLIDGDTIAVASLALRVVLESDVTAEPPKFRLLIRDVSYGLRSPFTVGGAIGDDVILDGWPPRAAVFRVADDELFVEPGVALTHNGERVEPGEELVPLEIGDVLGCEGTTIKIGAAPQRALTTITGNAQPLPSKIIVEMLPRGGRVVFSMPSGDYCVYLADRRLDLIAALLRPPSGFVPGDYIPDDVLRPLVWPGNPNVIRSEINVHITRCRKDLVNAGLAGPRLLQRSPGGGATRLALAPHCIVEFL